MTSNQIALFNAKEAQRHNYAYENETQRHNVKSEGISLASLAEQTRHSKATEKQARKELKEDIRHNKRGEKTDIYNAKTNRKNAKTNRINAKSNRINARANVANAKTNARNASTNAFNARINLMNANTNATAVAQQGAHYVRSDKIALGKLGLDKKTLKWKSSENAKDRQLKGSIEHRKINTDILKQQRDQTFKRVQNEKDRNVDLYNAAMARQSNERNADKRAETDTWNARRRVFGQFGQALINKQSDSVEQAAALGLL